MANARVPVDLFNPGQVFACYGLLEAAEVLLGDARGGFDWANSAQAWFNVGARGAADPVAEVLAFLENATVGSLAAVDSEHGTEKWQVFTHRVPAGRPCAYGNPDSPAPLPAVLKCDDTRIVIDHWGDRTRRDNVKFWAGSAGYPGAALLRDALNLVRTRLGGASTDPFAISAPQKSSFRFDWRRDYVPLGVGFSLNEHSSVVPQGYPVVEILAAIGLTHARPERPDRRNKLIYRYRVMAGDSLAPMLLRAGLGCADLPFPTRTFRVQLEWPGQANQARCITNTTEES